MLITMPTVITWRGTKVKVLSSVKKQVLELFYQSNPSAPNGKIKEIARTIKHPLDIVTSWLANRAAGLRVHSCCKSCPTYFSFDTAQVLEKKCAFPGPKKGKKRKLPTEANNNLPQKKMKLKHSSCSSADYSSTRPNTIKLPPGLKLKDMQPVVVLRRLNLLCFQPECLPCTSQAFKSRVNYLI